MMSEDHSSLSARVFHAIREDILNGKYQANEELKEKSIGEELGVSRTPVREALRQLELEGLVHIIPNKGAFVEGITLKDVKDIYDKVYAKAVDQITGELLEYDERVKEAVEEGDKVDAVYGITIDWPEEYKPEEDE